MLSVIVAFGVPAKRPTGVCRGDVYIVDGENGKPIQLVRGSFAKNPWSYAVADGPCSAPLSSAVLIVGDLDDRDLQGLLDALKHRRIAPDADRPSDIHIDDKWRLAGFVRDGEQVVCAMVDPADDEQVRSVHFVKETRGDWSIAYVSEPGQP